MWLNIFCLRVNAERSQALIMCHSVGTELVYSSFQSKRQSPNIYCHILVCLFSFLDIRYCLNQFFVSVAHHAGILFGLGALYVLRHSQIDELVLGLCLHHTRALLSHHLDVFRDVNITVNAYRRK